MKDKDVTVKLVNSTPTKKLKELADVKQINHGMNAFIIDDKKVILAISDFKKEKPEYHFTILNEHKSMVTTLQHYFEKNWKDAKNY